MGVAMGMTMVVGCKTGNANAPSTPPQGTGQTNRVETDSNTTPAPKASRTDTSLIKNTRHADDDLLILGEISMPDSIDSTEVDPSDPFPLGKIAPTKPEKKKEAQKTPKKNKKKGRKRR